MVCRAYLSNWLYISVAWLVAGTGFVQERTTCELRKTV
jgi:hypothetical protein